MYMQNLKLLLSTVQDEMHLQLKHYLTIVLDLVVNVTQNVAQYPPHHVTYAASKFYVATSDGSGGDAFTNKTLFDL